MSLYTTRRSSLRQSLSGALLRRLSRLPVTVGRLKGRYLFRSAVRRVLEFMEWITEEPVVEELGDDVTINIKIAQRKYKIEKKLTLKDRSILLVNPSERSSADKKYIYDLIKKLHAFTKYPEDLRENLAAVCVYQYLPAGRVIVRLGHRAHNLYFIVNGELSLSRVAIDELTGDKKEIDMGIMQAGDIFGEIALLHTLLRTSTVITKTSVDLLLITRDDFDNILRPVLIEKWAILHDALVHFNYFKLWDKKTIRECCILSKLKDFNTNEVLLGDGTGMVNYVHFILSGECRVIEHMLIRESFSYPEIRYELYNPESDDHQLEQQQIRKRPEMHADVDRYSIVTTTLLDVIKGWHEITDVAAMLMREPSVTSQLRYPSDVRTIFMQVCTFSRGACFGLGEEMLNRRVVAITPVRCLLVPRYWLFDYNRANIWERVKLFMNSKYPTKKQLFDKFLQDQKWRTYKQNLVKNIIEKYGCSYNIATVYSVPYSIRITGGMDSKL